MADEEERILRYYFYTGFEYATILHFLESYHSIKMSYRTLLRRLDKLNLRRRNYTIDHDVLRNHIREEVGAPGGTLKGYRSMWHTLRYKHQVQAPRRVVALLLHEIDPHQSNVRRRRRLTRRSYFAYGPNFSWHVDGYDKLKPFGLPIHGAIDGYSRKILWLKVVRSNNLPSVPGKLFLDAVKEVGGCPVLLRSDGGTENGLMAAAQCFFRMNGSDPFAGNKSYRKGTSPSNQRIECWWSVFRRGNSSWWIDFFKDLSHQGYLDSGNKVHLELLWFCFSAVLQCFLDDVKQFWNTHRIRKSAYSAVSGVPNILFYMPEESGAIECKCTPPNFAQMAQVEHECNYEEEDSDARQYLNYLIQSNNLTQPTNVKDAYEMYMQLLMIANSFN